MSDECLNIEVTDNVKSTISPLIEDRVAALLQDEDKSSLVQYILLLVSNNRSKGHVQEDLASFLGPDEAVSFTDWLWETLKSSFSTQGDQTQPEPVSRKRPAPPAGANRLFKSALSATRNTARRPPKGNISKQEPRQEPTQPAKKRRVVVKKPKGRTEGGGATEAMEVVVDTRLSPSAAPQVDPDQRQTSVMDETEDTDFVAVVPPRQPKVVVKSTTRRLEHKIEALAAELRATRAAGGQRRRTIGRPPKPGDVRCRYWPICTRGTSCKFYHPSLPCKWFPKCTHGNKCLFVHPPCKFKSKCTKPECIFAHPLASRPTPQQTQGAKKDGDSQAPVCRYDPRCNSISCQFAHPKREAAEAQMFGETAQETDTLSKTLPGTPPHLKETST